MASSRTVQVLLDASGFVAGSKVVKSTVDGVAANSEAMGRRVSGAAARIGLPHTRGGVPGSTGATTFAPAAPDYSQRQRVGERINVRPENRGRPVAALEKLPRLEAPVAAHEGIAEAMRRGYHDGRHHNQDRDRWPRLGQSRRRWRSDSARRHGCHPSHAPRLGPATMTGRRATPSNPPSRLAPNLIRDVRAGISADAVAVDRRWSRR